MYYGYVLCIHMPKVTIWIRNEDHAAWESIKSKPEFIHGVLEQVKLKLSKQEVHYDKPETTA